MTRTAWECPRCQRMNAPHVDHCDCAPNTPELALPPTWKRITIGDPPYSPPYTTSSGTITEPSPIGIAITSTQPKPHTYYVS